MTRSVKLAPNVSATLLAAARGALLADEITPRAKELTKLFPTLSVSILKQCDDQVITALSVINRILQRIQQPATWDDWGVISCPRRSGRKRLSESLIKFRSQGAWSTSPHLIPHHLLHSSSGIISQALGLHGPNMGVGGTLGSEENVLTSAAAWLAGGDAASVWLVWTNWDCETLEKATCEARVALITRAEYSAEAESFWTVFERVEMEGSS
jgi:hypothetical protein